MFYIARRVSKKITLDVIGKNLEHSILNSGDHNAKERDTAHEVRERNTAHDVREISSRRWLIFHSHKPITAHEEQITTKKAYES